MSVIEQILLDIVVGAFPEVSTSNITLDTPPKKELGDFAFNVFPYAKATRLAPPVIAEKIADELKKHSDYFQNVSIMGGYVNFFLTTQAWMDIFNNLSTTDKPKNNETVVVDYIGSNIGKPLHIGHMCTPVIGQSIINIYRYLGYVVVGDNHLGDWGGVFGKLITARKIQLYKQNPENIDEGNRDMYMNLLEQLKSVPASEEGTVSDAMTRWMKQEYLPEEQLQSFADSYIVMTYLGEQNEIYEIQGRAEFKKLSEADRENVVVWQQITSVSIAALAILLDRLNIKSDCAVGESFYEGLPLPKIGKQPDLVYDMKSIVQEVVDKGIAVRNEDGSVGVTFPEDTKLPSCMLAKRNGTHGYLASDLATIKYRMTNGWNPIKILYSVDIRQQLHLKQCFWIAKQVWPEFLENVEITHMANGAIRLKEGAMSSRKGRVISLDKLLDEGVERTEKIIQEKGQILTKKDLEAISIGAIKYSYLAQDREKDVVFDWDKALSFEGNSGPYIQYSYVRAKNIIEKANIKVPVPLVPVPLSQYDTSCLRQLSFFGKAVSDSALKYKPHIIASYCYDLASEFNAFYVHTPKILEEQDENLRNFRLALIGKVAETLEKGFELLAIEMPSKM